jgi:hypothetical protein
MDGINHKVDYTLIELLVTLQDVIEEIIWILA